jgi:hypothetical protein
VYMFSRLEHLYCPNQSERIVCFHPKLWVSDGLFVPSFALHMNQFVVQGFENVVWVCGNN